MLLEVTSKQVFSHIIIKDVLDKYDYLEVQEKRFIKRLFEGTIERMIELDYIIAQYAKVKGNKMKPAIRNILRMSIYQLLYMDSVPDSAVCNEAVKLVKKKKYHQLGGFVNGVLRTISRERSEIVYPDKEKEPVKWLSIQYSMPEWILEKWIPVYGIEAVANMVESMLQEQPITVRIDETCSKEEVAAVLEEWNRRGVVYTQHSYLPYAYQLQRVDGIASYEGFQQGWYTVQDISSMLVAEVAHVAADDCVLDVCAAPGGKTLHIATKLKALNGHGTVEARDVSQIKCDYIEENRCRLQLTNVTTRVADARVYEKQLKETVDLVIADVPCSGLGVMGKKRDIKYHMNPAQIAEIVQLQRQIMSVVKEYVKVGGTLLYSTCTINPEENEEMVAWLVSEGGFELEAIDSYLPECLHSDTTQLGYLQLVPSVQESDGFFLARLRRIEEG